jgi:hypothetical protein
MRSRQSRTKTEMSYGELDTFFENQASLQKVLLITFCYRLLSGGQPWEGKRDGPLIRLVATHQKLVASVLIL